MNVLSDYNVLEGTDDYDVKSIEDTIILDKSLSSSSDSNSDFSSCNNLVDELSQMTANKIEKVLPCEFINFQNYTSLAEQEKKINIINNGHDLLDEGNITDLNNIAKVASVHKSMKTDIVSIQPEMNTSLELITMLQSANAPIHLYDKIIKWSLRNSNLLLKNKKLPSREHLINHFANRYNMKSLYPYQIKCPLQGSETNIDLTCHSFSAAISSLLEDPDLMQANNLLFQNCEDPSQYNMDLDKNLQDVNTGTVYKNAVDLYCTSNGDEVSNKVLIPIILFIDATQIDALSRHVLEPVYFTLGIFNNSTRRKSNAWKSLGFIKVNNYGKDDNGAMQHNIDPSERSHPNNRHNNTNHPKQGIPGYVPPKLRDYHSMLNSILEEVVEATNCDNGIPWKFTIDNVHNNSNYNLIFKILFIIGDTLAHDKLVCMVKGPSSKNNLCRYCNCPFEETDNPKFKFKYTNMMDLKDKFHRKKYEKIKKKMGYYPLQDNVFFKMMYCDNNRGANGAMPSEALHFILLGYYIYAISAFKNLRNNEMTNSNYIFGAKLIDWTNQRCKIIGFHLSTQSDRSLPRTHFPSGYLVKRSKNKEDTTGKKLGRN
jgi:hypothetical protein